MNFSVNQNRQFYVVNSVGTTTPTAEGGIFVSSDANGFISFQHYGKGGLTRSDLIDPATILYANATAPAAMQHKMKTYTVALDTNVNEGKPIVGQDYLLRLVIHSYVGMSDAEPYIKYGVVHATSAMNATPSLFYKELALSLVKNFQREAWPILNFSLLTESNPVPVTAATSAASLNGTYTGILIEEAPQDWRLGVMEQTFVRYDVIPTTVVLNGDEVVWGTAVAGESSTNIVGNGKKIADLEYFCMGERGDQYRKLGWPNNIDTAYMVDPTKEYYVVDIHYAFVGAGEQPMKSEKTITFVSDTKDTINTLITKINAKQANLLTAFS